MSSGQPIMWGHVTDCAVKTREVVALNECLNRSVRIVFAQQNTWSNAILFYRLVKAFNLAVALWVIGTRSNVAHARNANELFEVSRHELLAVVGDDSRSCVGILFSRFLKNDFHI